MLLRYVQPNLEFLDFHRYNPLSSVRITLSCLSTITSSNSAAGKNWMKIFIWFSDFG